jgi:hypothetical protein
MDERKGEGDETGEVQLATGDQQASFRELTFLGHQM